MNRAISIQHKFVEFIPEILNEGEIYISIRYATASHNCCCGCGSKTVTPLTPHDWKLVFDGKTVSLIPSIGNWSLKCQSHYWIRRNKVVWARQFSKTEVNAGRALDRYRKARSFSEKFASLMRYVSLRAKSKIRRLKE